MAIVQTLTKSAFIDAFKQSSRKDQFSYEALEAIFDYLEEYSDSTGEPVEFDIVGICCDWTEADWKTIADDYSIDLVDCARRIVGEGHIDFTIGRIDCAPFRPVHLGRTGCIGGQPCVNQHFRVVRERVGLMACIDVIAA